MLARKSIDINKIFENLPNAEYWKLLIDFNLLTIDPSIFRSTMSKWQTESNYKKMAEMIIAAQDPYSSLSEYFQDLKEHENLLLQK